MSLKAFFFRGNEYFSYDIAADKVDSGYPLPIEGHWRGLPPNFNEGIDAVVSRNNGKLDLFKSNQVITYDIAANMAEDIPQLIAERWPALPAAFSEGVDAALIWNDGYAYFFKGTEFVRYDIGSNTIDEGQALPIFDRWPGLPPEFPFAFAGFDAVVRWNNGKAYFFKGDQYFRYDIARNSFDLSTIPGTVVPFPFAMPQPIAGNWPGLTGPVHAAMLWTAAPLTGQSQVTHVPGVWGQHTARGYGVLGESDSNYGVAGNSQTEAGVRGYSKNHVGVVGDSDGFDGIFGHTNKQGAAGVSGHHDGQGSGIWGGSNKGCGVYGHSNSFCGIQGESDQFDGVSGMSHSPEHAGVSGHNDKNGPAGFFEGSVVVTGNLRVDGDILLAHNDCAEEFDMQDMGAAEPGTVMVLTDDGDVAVCSEPYDRRVAGVVSGAGVYKPAIVLDHRTSPLRRPLAMLGKVFCKADASYGAIRVGDLLTTSATAGHAMRADDCTRAFGSVIGKAMGCLASGQALIPVLVALQ